jgi:hypothetical protein
MLQPPGFSFHLQTLLEHLQHDVRHPVHLALIQADAAFVSRRGCVRRAAPA